MGVRLGDRSRMRMRLGHRSMMGDRSRVAIKLGDRSRIGVMAERQE